MISLQVAGAAPAPQPWPSRPLISTWSDVLAARNWGHEWCLEVDYSEQQIWRWNGRIGDATLYLIPEQRVGPVCFALLGCFKLNLLDQLSSADPSTHLHPRAQKFAHQLSHLLVDVIILLKRLVDETHRQSVVTHES